MRARFAQKCRARRGITLTELLVVLAIIGLLATIAIPVYLTRMELARVRTAQLEVQEIAHAEEQCAILHTFYVPFQILDNIAREDSSVTRTPPADSFVNEASGNIYVIDPYTNATIQAGGTQLRLGDTWNARVQDMILGWQGPFLNSQRVYLRATVSAPINSFDVRHDWPLDPWGQPYRFFSPIGPIGSRWYQLNPENQDDDYFSDGKLLDDPSNDPFDRYAIVSLGANGVLDSATDADYDDVVYTFGMVPNTTGFYRYFR